MFQTFYGFLLAKGWVVEDVSQEVAVDLAALSHEQRESDIRIPFARLEVNKLVAHLRSELAVVDAEIDSVGRSKDYMAAGREAKLNKLAERRQFLAFWQFAVRVSFETGLRLSDICQLEWSCFATAGQLNTWSDKTNKRVSLAFNDELTELLAALPVVHAKYLFPEQRALILSIKKRGGLSVQFKRLCEKLEIHGKSFHCLRHGAATEKYHKADKSALAEQLAKVLTTAQIQQLLGQPSATCELTGIEKYVPP
jgi:integrase